jgi:aspartyl-tRNA(Asn)/glutamyl-tRNA(Gln) amidotransferase subunit B
MSGEGGPREVAEQRDLLQVSDVGALEEVVASVLAENPGAVDEFRNGEEKVVGFLVGQVMKATQGKADPRLVNQLLRDKMSS